MNNTGYTVMDVMNKAVAEFLQKYGGKEPKQGSFFLCKKGELYCRMIRQKEKSHLFRGRTFLYFFCSIELMK
ncbi:hypothetical protein EDM59_01415 [Brevibacillus nitrificans]|uniref:Uncharacterized protein n=1 Tax=Brevibacillus nitrificans TaxID=651560 RepID=A0A3M8DRP7_9BACL|nr:hypothetical protein EDM59_01415 [Brevibacillus nitrificans]